MCRVPAPGRRRAGWPSRRTRRRSAGGVVADLRDATSPGHCPTVARNRRIVSSTGVTLSTSGGGELACVVENLAEMGILTGSSSRGDRWGAATVRLLRRLSGRTLVRAPQSRTPRYTGHAVAPLVAGALVTAPSSRPPRIRPGVAVDHHLVDDRPRRRPPPPRPPRRRPRRARLNHAKPDPTPSPPANQVSQNQAMLTQLTARSPGSHAEAGRSAPRSTPRSKLDATRAEMERLRQIVRTRRVHVPARRRRNCGGRHQHVVDISAGRNTRVGDPDRRHEDGDLASVRTARPARSWRARVRAGTGEARLDEATATLEALTAPEKLLDQAGAVPVMGDAGLPRPRSPRFEARQYRLAGACRSATSFRLQDGGKAEHVRPELAFAQSIIETGSFGNALDNASRRYRAPATAGRTRSPLRDGVRGQISSCATTPTQPHGRRTWPTRRPTITRDPVVPPVLRHLLRGVPRRGTLGSATGYRPGCGRVLTVLPDGTHSEPADRHRRHASPGRAADTRDVDDYGARLFSRGRRAPEHPVTAGRGAGRRGQSGVAARACGGSLASTSGRRGRARSADAATGTR